MRPTFSRILLAATLGLSATMLGTVAVSAQPQGGTQAQRATNLRATADLRARIDATDARIAEGRRNGVVTRARAATLRRQVAQTRNSMTRLARQQGFVSAAELASYNRTLGTIDLELDRRGVARSYGNDMLPAPASDAAEFRYDCQNVPVAFAIRGDRLERSLDAFRMTTHCPVSGSDLARGRQGRPVVGTMTPSAALQGMLAGSGLQMRTIRGGFQIVRPSR